MDQANEILVGLQVDNEELYAKYRAEMTPLLEAHGGCFVVDVRVAAVLRAPVVLRSTDCSRFGFPHRAGVGRVFLQS